MSGGPDEAESALDNMSRLLKELDERDRATVAKSFEELEPKLNAVRTGADRR